jgi:hypothetical protein
MRPAQSVAQETTADAPGHANGLVPQPKAFIKTLGRDATPPDERPPAGVAGQTKDTMGSHAGRRAPTSRLSRRSAQSPKPGAATIGLELTGTVPSFDAVLVALSGGALATGVGHVTKARALLIWRCRRQSLQDQIPEEAHVRPGQLRPAEEDGTAELSPRDHRP